MSLHDGKPNGSSTEDYPFDLNLKRFYRKINGNKDAELWFNRGLIWCYGFNHEEAIICFQHAIDADPNCAIAYWGVAYALGPNYNKIWQIYTDLDLAKSLATAYQNARTALTKIEHATEAETALIKAIQHRYPQESLLRKDIDETRVWNTNYADNMKLVYAKFGEDADVVTLYVDSLLMISPWAMWDLKTRKPNPAARTVEARKALEDALRVEKWNDHPGLCHLYVHLMEMSTEPEAAIPAADKLRGLIPDAGHLHHMPTHIDVLTGSYEKAVKSNEQAIEADERYVREKTKRGQRALWYTTYRIHDYHLLIYAAMMSGQSKKALANVEALEANITEEILRETELPLADWLEAYLNTRVHVLIRFGRWDDLLALSYPSDQELYCVTTAHVHYGKAIAYAALGRIEEAEEEKKKFDQAKQRVVDKKTRYDHKNPSTVVLDLAEVMLKGELEYRRGNFDDAFKHLQDAVERDDALKYAEPWGWMVPTRHAYAALLLEQNKVLEALALYLADLGNDPTVPRARWHPKNIWALCGLYECLRKAQDSEEAQKVYADRKLALGKADVDIKVSCFCRRVAETSTA